ncbi:ABC transporter permease [Streptococcus oricebi]|uniref:ABC transporter permease n=1 Tax=Streptococcus oricebi TaxID=1547447 RepID=A0ABS5B3G2_9STRE|nr:ABC transporter permease [Streptococcus oricebi]MBP2622504.1 ABC transporter permease [Streptococcus oricebi]
MEDIFVALNSILSHKMRSTLTMLGIIIGIGAIIAIFSIIEGNSENTKRQLIGGSNNSLNVVYNKKNAINPDIPDKANAKKPLYLPFLGEETLEQIKKIPGVKNAVLSYQKENQIYYLQNKATSKVIATSQNIAEVKKMKTTSGADFSDPAFRNQEQVVYLEKSLYQTLFPAGDGLGKYVEIKGNPFKVIGVFESKKASGLTAGTENLAYIPLNQWHRIFEEIDVSPEVTVQTERADGLKPAAKKVGDYLNSLVPDSDYMFGVMNLREFERQLTKLNQSNFVLLAGIASISLLVGGIGVMNIMLVSVTERTREIGVKKALGARRKVILKQFLIEAVILTLMGGVIGVLAGIISGLVITRSLDYPYILSLFSVFVSLLFCCIIGVVFGLLPAVKASKLNPIEALRFE